MPVTSEHIKIGATKKARKLIRKIAAETNEKQYQLLERVLEEEMKRKNLK